MTMNSTYSFLTLTLAALAMALSSCEEPRSVGTGDAGEIEDAAGGEDESETGIRPGGSVVYGNETEEEEAEAEESAEESPAERKQPELRVYWEEDAIIAEGAFTSRIQQERIGKELSEAFTGTRVENRVELDYDRFPVGWGNRVTEAFLIPFFQNVEDASVKYEKGVITLGGRGDKRARNFFQKLAIDVFAGTFTENIENEIAIE